MPKGFTEEEKALIRAGLLAKGKELFQRYGLKKTSVEELARAVGISKGAFYLFYGSKEELFLEVLEQLEAEFRAGILAITPQPGQPARECFRELMRMAFSAWKANPMLSGVGQEEYAALLRKVPAERVRAHLQGDDVFVAELLERWRAAGVPVTADPKTAAGLMSALFFVSLHEGEFGQGAYPAAMGVLIDLVAGYLIKETGSQDR